MNANLQKYYVNSKYCITMKYYTFLGKTNNSIRYLIFSADDKFPGGVDKYKTEINLYFDGNCSWYSPATFTTTCKINMR